MSVASRTAATILAVLVTACASRPQFKHEDSVFTRDPQGAELGFQLAVIEFDEQGEMFDRTQFNRAMEVIGTANESAKGAVVFVYVHGWNHSASARQEVEGNLADFRDLFLRRIHEEELRGDKRPVVGVYVAWRGKSFTWPVSYWSRNAAANRIADIQATEVLYGLQKKARSNENTRLLIIGHSMGGLIVERAMMPAFATEVMSVGTNMTKAVKAGLLPAAAISNGVVTPWTPPADLVLLINPASPALEAKKFIDMLHAWQTRFGLEKRRISVNQVEVEPVPMLVTMTSVNDWPNRGPYWAGNVLARRHQRTRRDRSELGSQRSLLTHTAGNMKRFQTHVFDYPRDEQRPIPSCDPAPQWEVKGSTCYRYDGETFAFHRSGQRYNDTPYWFMQVPKKILPDHSKIFRDSYPMIRGLLETVHALRRDRTTYVSSLAPDLASSTEQSLGSEWYEGRVLQVVTIEKGGPTNDSAKPCPSSTPEQCPPCAPAGKGGGSETPPSVSDQVVPCWELVAPPDGCFVRHTVVPGDWLSKLAEKQYGDRNLWPFIHQFNPQIRNPHRIFPGQQLRYPESGPKP